MNLEPSLFRPATRCTLAALAAVLAVAATVLGCADGSRIRLLEATVERLEGELDERRRELIEMRQDLDAGAEAVAAGMTGLVRMEPFDAAPLYADSASLSGYVDLLLAEIERRSFAAGIVGVEPGDDLAIRVTSFAGVLRLDLWIDDRRETPVVRYALRSPDVDPLTLLGIPGDTAERQLEAWAEEANPENREGSVIAAAYKPIPPCYRDVPCLPDVFAAVVSRDHREIDVAWRREVEERLGAYLREPFATVAAPEELLLPLNNRLWTPGRHTLFVGLVPETAFDGHWHLSLELVDAAGEVLLKWRIDSEDPRYPWSPGEALAPIRLGEVVVRLDGWAKLGSQVRTLGSDDEEP